MVAHHVVVVAVMATEVRSKHTLFFGFIPAFLLRVHAKYSYKMLHFDTNVGYGGGGGGGGGYGGGSYGGSYGGGQNHSGPDWWGDN